MWKYGSRENSMRSSRAAPVIISLIIALAVLSIDWDRGRAVAVLNAKEELRTAPTITKDVAKDYGGVSGDTINQAITDAKAFLGANPDATYLITIPAGTFTVAKTINVSNIGSRNGKGRLIVQGAGKDQTTLVSNPDQTGIQGRDTYHVSFIGIHFTLPNYTVSQGHVVSVAPGQVVIDIQKGFPSPNTIMADRWVDCYEQNHADAKSRCGPMRRYMRKYQDSRTDPHMVEENNKQLAWFLTSPEAGVDGRWKFTLSNQSTTAPYAPGDLVGLKSKSLANTYFFCGGSDFEFKDIRWTHRSRGKFRCGFDHVTISGTEILRGPPVNGQVPALSSPGGGPQIGHDGEATGHNLVENNRFVGTGDDSIGLFDNDGTTVVRNNQIYDSFARGILLKNSPSVQLEGNAVARSPVTYR